MEFLLALGVQGELGWAWKRLMHVLDLLDAGFHPDTPFKDYVRIGTSGERSFSDEQAEILDANLALAWAIRDENGLDIYEQHFPVAMNLLCAQRAGVEGLSTVDDRYLPGL